MRLAFLALILVSSVGLASADPAAVGLTGLGEMRTPQTLQAGRSEFYLHTRFASVSDNIGSRFSPGLGYDYGIMDGMEAGLQIPFRFVDSASGLGDIPLLYKYRFYDAAPLTFAGTAFLDLPTASKSSDMGSGKLGFGAELNGSSKFGSLEIVGSVNYGKGDYCVRCEYPGTQRMPEIINVPVVNLAGAVEYSDKDYSAYGEAHFLNVANAVKSGTLTGDPDLYLLLGGRYNVSEDVHVGGYAGVGLAGNRSNTKALVNVLASYAFGGAVEEAAAKPAAKPAGAPAPAKKPAAPAPAAQPQAAAPVPAPAQELFADVVDACQAPEFTSKFIAGLNAKNIKTKLAGSAKKMDQSAIYFTDAGVNLGSEVARSMSGMQKMFKQQSIPGGAAVRVFLGCDMAAPAAAAPAPAAPLPPKKPKANINVAVINGCGKPGLAEDAAKTLLLNAYNVTKIFDEPKPTTPGITEIRIREQYKDEATDIEAKLPGQQRTFVDKTLPEDTDIQVTVGCKQ